MAPDGLPLPPTRLIVLVAGTPEPEWFLESGALAARSIRGVLGKAGVEIERLDALLDFGCGCGRVLRQWAHLDGPEVWGSDYNERLVAWCRENLGFADVARNALEPPLAFEDERFDLVYALSVFTHFPERLQHAWMAELRRVVKPGGLVLFSAHGRRYLDRLEEGERELFLADQPVVRWERVAGTNLCAAYHPQAWVQQELARDLELVEFVPEGAQGNPHQDLYLLRRPS
jgi:SAM-dependent methyltransferase